jgi:hypothetical protein
LGNGRQLIAQIPADALINSSALIENPLGNKKGRSPLKRNLLVSLPFRRKQQKETTGVH